MALSQSDPALAGGLPKPLVSFLGTAEPAEFDLMIDLTKLQPAESGDLVVLERLGRQAVTHENGQARSDAGKVVPTLSGLSREARIVVEVAAMMADSFSVSEVADILGQPAGHIVQAVKEVIQAGILASESGRLDFADEELRRCVYEELPEPLRVGLHGHIGRQLLERGASPAVSALHLILGTRPGDHQALEYLDRATQELMPTFAKAAADVAVGALALTEGTDSHRWTRRISAVDALVAAERPHEALELARRGIADGQVPGVAAAQLRLRVASNLLAQGLAAECLEELAILMRTNSLPSAI